MTNMLNDESFSQANEKTSLYQDEKEMVVPVIQEFVSVDKKKVETATVTITKKVSEATETVDVMLQSEAYDIEHVPYNLYIDEDNIPATRQEGDTLIFPILKEVIVKRMLLVEEVRMTKKITQTIESKEITLRAETIDVKRVPVTEK